LDTIAGVLKDRLAALGGKVELVEAGADAVRLFDTRHGLAGPCSRSSRGREGGRSCCSRTWTPCIRAARSPSALFRVEGSRAYGHGFASKGGVASSLTGCHLKESLREYGALTVLINGDEFQHGRARR